LTENKDVITAVKDLETIVALVIGLTSIVVAAFQLKITAANIKSNTVYQISHEGRDIAKSLAPNMSADRIGPVLSFIYTVWNQHRFGTYDDDLWEPFREEVCQFLKSQSNFGDYWLSNQKLFSKDFVTFIEERRKQCA
jgi:hypothetical protein